MKPLKGLWSRSSRHFAQVEVGPASHWLRLPAHPRMLAILAEAGRLPSGDEPGISNPERIRRASLWSALNAASVGLAWASATDVLETALPVVGVSLLDYGATVYDELLDYGATDDQISGAAESVFSAIHSAVSTGAEEVKIHEDFSKGPKGP